MNEKLESLKAQAEFVGDRYSLPDEFAEKFAELVVKDLLDLINDANVNRCALTTYDQGIALCTKSQIIDIVRAHYGVKYRPQPVSQRLFPVASVRS